MNQLDVYYRALTAYRRETTADHACSALRAAIADADIEQDEILIKRAFCTIEEDWVEAIEAGLIHVEKALKEERQFIRSFGEVIPIEKVKHVSRESVEHLARHSNLITQCEDEDNLIPEKLYAVERMSEYAVYENRFLYMLLCYLRDFITIRYNDILELSNRYDASVNWQKKISTGKRKMTYTLSMHEIKRDDPYLAETNPAKDILDRIHMTLKTVIAFLSTPLMQEVSKVAMLKPPITKTNVLKMNNNFKGAVALYEFIMAYNKKGYEVEEQTTRLAPFQDQLADELAEAGSLVSFLVYEYGLAINKELKESYQREEERRKADAIRQREERIKKLKRKLKNSEITAEEYALTLEDQLRDLSGQAERAEKLADDLAAEREKTAQLTQTVERLTKTIDQLNEYIEDLKHQHFLEIERLKKEYEEAMHELIVKHENEMRECVERYEAQIADMKEKHEKEMRECVERYEAQIASLIEKHENEMRECIERYEAQIASLIEKYENEMRECVERYEAQIADMKEKHENEMRECVERYETQVASLLEKHENELRELKEQYALEIQELNQNHENELESVKAEAKAAAELHEAELLNAKESAKAEFEKMRCERDEVIADLQEKHSLCAKELKKTHEEYASLLDDYRLSNARVKALGGITEDYTDREHFNELENEYNTFTRLYKQQWKKTKKEIKKQHLNIKNLKEQKESEKEAEKPLTPTDENDA